MWDLEQAETAFFQTLVLTGLSPLAGERTPQSLFYILQGRKANQTFQDVQIFSLQPYYRLFPALLRERWEETVEKLVESGCLVAEEMAGNRPKHTFRITEHGQQYVVHGDKVYRMQHWLEPLRGEVRLPQLQETWLRLHLMIQTVSHLLSGNRHFTPLVQQKPVQQWVKRQLAAERRENWMARLNHELHQALQRLDGHLQQLLVRQWSGASQSGNTLHQLAYATEHAPSLLWLQTMHALALLRHAISSNQAAFPLLAELFGINHAQRRHAPLLSESAQASRTLLEKGLSLEQVAGARGLKLNTIEDHLVEIALSDEKWKLDDYLAPVDRTAILAASQALGTRRLRMIKDHFGNRYTYLQIRLALTRLKEGESDEDHPNSPD